MNARLNGHNPSHTVTITEIFLYSFFLSGKYLKYFSGRPSPVSGRTAGDAALERMVEMTYYISRKKRNAPAKLSQSLQECMSQCQKNWKEIVILCIGSDRITGDSLGPYVGYRLSQHHLPSTFIYGTLQAPVHALNLRETVEEIYSRHPHCLLIAIDASIGSKNHLGYITVCSGALHPGAGVHKDLPAVGDISITGIVCSSGLFEQLALQNTRLSFVISMADIIAAALLSVCRKVYGQPRLRFFEACFHFPEGRLRRATKLPSLAAFTEDRS